MIGQTVGKYRVEDRIGRGGMGTVYRAVDETLHREVAIKVLNSELNDPEVAKRFRAEAITVAKLSHPGIATVYELFEHDGQWLMVMEFVRGETLERLIERAGPISAERAADLCMQALNALTHAHGVGVVHRDLKPANLMLTDSGMVKIMDFGIARVSGSEHLTSAGFMMGTPAYMAPEQVLGQEVDARANLYAMGVVLYRLTTGKLPFKGETPFALAQSQVNDPPTPVRMAREGLPLWLEQVLTRVLSKAPADRFQTAQEFREVLKRCLAGLPMEIPYDASAPTGMMLTPPGLPTGSFASQTPMAQRVPTGAQPASGQSGSIPAGTMGSAGAGQTGGSTGPGPAAQISGGYAGYTDSSAPTSMNLPSGTGASNLPALTAGADMAMTAYHPAPAASGTGAVAAGPATGGAPMAVPGGPGTTGAAAIVPPPAALPKPAAKPASAASSSSMVLMVAAAAVVVLGIGGFLWVRARHQAPPPDATAAAPAPPPADVTPAAPPPDTTAPPTATPATTAPASATGASVTPAGAQKPPATTAASSAAPGATTTPANAAVVPVGARQTAPGAAIPPGGRADAAGATPAGTIPAALPGAAPGTAPGTVPGAVPGRGMTTAPATATERAVPLDPNEPLAGFSDVKLLTFDGRKGQDQDVVLNFIGGQISVIPKKGGTPLTTMTYRKLWHATYSHTKDPKWDASLAGPPDDLDISGFMRGARHWLVLQSKTAPFIILRLDDSNWQRILETLEARTALKVDRPDPAGK